MRTVATGGAAATATTGRASAAGGGAPRNAKPATRPVGRTGRGRRASSGWSPEAGRLRQGEQYPGRRAPERRPEGGERVARSAAPDEDEQQPHVHGVRQDDERDVSSAPTSRTPDG